VGVSREGAAVTWEVVMSPEVAKRLRGWIYLRAPEVGWEEVGGSWELVLRQDLDEGKLLLIAAGIVLIESRSEQECGERASEVCDLGVDRGVFLGALERTAEIIGGAWKEGGTE
jgi:hypothetical protein